MRIAVYCPDFYPSVSGYSFAFQDLALGLCAEGVEVDIFTPTNLSTSVELSSPGLTINRLSFSEPLRYIKYVRALWNLFSKPRQTAKTITKFHKKRRFDALLFETVEDPLLLLNIPTDLRERSVVRIHACAETELAMWDSSLIWRLKRRLIARVLTRDIRFITATADFYLEFVRRHFLKGNVLKIADKRFAVVPNSAPQLERRPRSEPLPNSRRRFMTLGRMDWVGANQKGFDDILMALHEMSPKQRSNIHLTIIGNGSEQPRIRSIAMKIPDVEIDFFTTLPNSAVRDMLNNVDGVILASRYEGMSIFALEAVGAGAPVIFSNAGGIAALVRNNGLQFVAGDPRSLARAWAEMLTSSPKQWEEMSKASIAIARELTTASAARTMLRYITVALPSTDTVNR